MEIQLISLIFFQPASELLHGEWEAKKPLRKHKEIEKHVAKHILQVPQRLVPDLILLSETCCYKIM